MFRLTRGCYIILILFTFFSCREKVNIDFPDFTPVPVLNGLLIVGNPAIVHVSLAGKMDTVPLQIVSNAIIELYVDNKFTETLIHVGEGNYQSSLIVEAEKLYTCKVMIHGYTTVSASTFIPAPATIYGFEHINVAGKATDGMSFPAFKLSFANDKMHERYFEIRMKIMVNGAEREGRLFQEKINDPVLLNEGLPLPLFSNQIINSSEYEMYVNYITGYSGVSDNRTTLYPLQVELRSVPKEYYLFIRHAYLYNKGRYPDYDLNAYHVYPLYSNVENGYGIFTGYSSVRTEQINPSY